MEWISLRQNQEVFRVFLLKYVAFGSWCEKLSDSVNEGVLRCWLRKCNVNVTEKYREDFTKSDLPEAIQDVDELVSSSKQI